MSLETQIALAQSYLANGERLKKLLADREKAVAELAKIDEELTTLLPETPAPAPASNSTARTCKICGQPGHISRNGVCPKGNPPKE